LPDGERDSASGHVIAIPLLNDLAPNGFFMGGHYVIEFDSDSLWYETSLTIAALALKRGIKTEYHVFQHPTSEAVEEFARQGVDAKKLEKEGLLNFWDAYTPIVEYEAKVKVASDRERGAWGEPNDRRSDPERPLNLKEAGDYWAKKAAAGFKDEEKGWLHIDDNTAVMLQYNDEQTTINAWRTQGLPFGIRARECPHFLGYVRGVASEAFYKQLEALCDGIIDVKAQEEGGRIQNYIRVRTLRGKSFDSRWHRLRISAEGEVTFAGFDFGR